MEEVIQTSGKGLRDLKSTEEQEVSCCGKVCEKVNQVYKVYKTESKRNDESIYRDEITKAKEVGMKELGAIRLTEGKGTYDEEG